uniref:Uncharacterized protein n=1 Tax=Odontella aurita TaxID=265563 RepID=A0A7S4JNB7_9STRA|mmetsp:Transcript_50326/g.151552  ORF Transcript_50326/g.151552 Transcript_50326/m.151552 type:complete len:456 (+) Transcript_50326:186-1553(+)
MSSDNSIKAPMSPGALDSWSISDGPIRGGTKRGSVSLLNEEEKEEVKLHGKHEYDDAFSASKSTKDGCSNSSGEVTSDDEDRTPTLDPSAPPALTDIEAVMREMQAHEEDGDALGSGQKKKQEARETLQVYVTLATEDAGGVTATAATLNPSIARKSRVDDSSVLPWSKGKTCAIGARCCGCECHSSTSCKGIRWWAVTLAIVTIAAIALGIGLGVARRPQDGTTKAAATGTGASLGEDVGNGNALTPSSSPIPSSNTMLSVMPSPTPTLLPMLSPTPMPLPPITTPTLPHPFFCSCSPTIYRWTLNFNASCPPPDLSICPTCDVSDLFCDVKSDSDVTDQVPVVVESYTVLELDEELSAIKKLDPRKGLELRNGDEIEYASITAGNEEGPLKKWLGGLQMSIDGRNAAGEKLQSQWIIKFSGRCDVLPFRLEDGIGWIIFTGITPPRPELCKVT